MLPKDAPADIAQAYNAATDKQRAQPEDAPQVCHLSSIICYTPLTGAYPPFPALHPASGCVSGNCNGYAPGFGG